MRTLEGGCAQVREYTKDASEASAMYVWDLVNLEDDACIGSTGTPGASLFLGVSLNYAPTLTLSTHLVVCSPSAIFEAQDNAAVDGIAAVDIGLNANAELTAGSATTQISGHEIQETGAAVTASLDLKLLGLLNVPGNAFGSHARIEVIINSHAYANSVVGI